MTGIAVAGSDGSFDTASKVAVWDGSDFVPAEAVHVWDGSDFVKVWPSAAAAAKIKTFAAVLGTPAQTRVKLSWSGTGVLQFRLWRGAANTGVKLYEGTKTSFEDTVGTGTSNRYTLEGAIGTTVSTSGGGGWHYTLAKSLTIATSTGAAPADLRITANAWNGQTLAWNAAAGAIGYELHRVSPTASTVSLGVVTTYKITGTAEKTSYSWKVRAKFTGGTFGPYSNTLTFKSAAKPGPAPGKYTFKPTENDTWQSASKSWRPSGDALHHGNGAVYGSTRGTQTAFFYYGNDRFAALDGSKITKLEVWIQRTNDSVGLVGETMSHWLMHPHTARPGGAPTFGTWITDVGSLKRGEGMWVTLPVAWAGRLIENTTYRGIAWGNVSTSSRYMNASNSLAASSSGNPPNGTLRFTVG